MPGFNIPAPDSDCAPPGLEGKPPYDPPSYITESARKHRYIWEIFAAQSLGGSSLDWQSLLVYAYKCSRPTPEFDEITIHSAQDEIYRPGKNRWKPVEVSFYEVVNSAGEDSPAMLIYDWWAGDPRNSKSILDLRTSTHNVPKDYYRLCKLAMLDGEAKYIWQYELMDCWPSKVTPSDLSYADTDIADITVTLRFNKAREREG